MVKPTKVDLLRRRDAEGDKLAVVRQVDREERAEFYIGIGETHTRRIVEHLLEEAFREADLDDLAANRRAQDLASEIEDVYRRFLAAGRGALLRATSGGLAKRGHYRVDPARVRAEVDARRGQMSLSSARAFVARNSEQLFGERIRLAKVKADSSPSPSPKSRRSLTRPPRP